MVSLVLGYFAGSWIDKKFHTFPWFSVLGFLLGIAAGIKEIYTIAKKYQKELQKKAELPDTNREVTKVTPEKAP